MNKELEPNVDTNVVFPKTAVLELTYKCNHKCLFCSCPWDADVPDQNKYRKGDELDLEQWKKVLKILADLGVESVSISGGEALLCPFLLDLLHYIRTETLFNKDSEIVLISNGLAMTDDYLDAFKKYNIHLSMSLPGIETFARHTGADNVQGVLHWFSEAHKKGIHTTVNVTVTKLNYDELFQTIALGLLSGADSVLLNRFLPGGRGLSHVDELLLSKEQLAGMLDIAEQVLEHADRKGMVGTEFPRCVVDNIDKYKRLHVGTICSAAKEFFVVDPSGFVRVCNHSPRKVGHIFDKQIISDTEYWNIFAKRAYIPASCVNCKEVSYCDCGCREVAAIVKGDVCATDPCIDNK
ncbi:MAG: radical SAM protein [Bacteroidales bacterium]|nr:radical SAM protein [Bacteroidales bacterium]